MTAMLTRFIGRQPILDRTRDVFGYELLFRADEDNHYSGSDGDAAATAVMHNAMSVVGLESLTNGRRAFINVTRSILLSGGYRIMPARTTVLELLEDIPADREVIAACREARRLGYTLALDDFTNDPKLAPLTEVVDLLKVDLSLLDRRQWRAIAEQYANRPVKLLAEKVETPQMFDEVMRLGYTYFQGYFFQKPQVISAHELPGYVQNYLLFLQKVAKPNVDFDELERIVRQDVALSTKLLRYLNSAHFGMSSRIESIKQALVLMGEEPLRQWASVVALTYLGKDHPDELLVNALVRARMCELAAEPLNLGRRKFDLFMLGLLSLVDTMTRQPMDEVLIGLPLPHDIRAGLLGSRSTLGRLNAMVQCCERHDADGAEALAREIGLDEDLIPELYTQAIAWADEVFTR